MPLDIEFSSDPGRLDRERVHAWLAHESYWAAGRSRETQDAAIQLYESFGYVRWGRHPLYAVVEGQPVEGLFYYKRLDDGPG